MNRFRLTGRLALAAVTAASAALAVSAQASLDPNVVKQIKEIYSFKASLSPSEAKLSTNLLLVSRQAKGTLPANMKQYLAGAKRDSAGKLEVVVHGLKTSSFVDSASRAGVAMEESATPMAVVRSGRYHAHVTETELMKLAQQSDVMQIREAGYKHTNAGSVTSQGYVAMGANKVVPTGVTGAGIRIGVLSDSALPAQVASLIASGDLPSDVTVLPGQAGPTSGENEGTAMMEIIHDLAPDAKLFFATAFTSEDSFAQNIRDLRNVYGCDIIVDDISYFDEPAFQDGEIAQAVNDVTASGALYFSSAANSGNLSSTTSGTWEGDFAVGSGGGTLITTNEGQPVVLHNFGTAAAPQSYDVLTSGTTFIGLHWSDPLGSAANDYDLFLLNSTGTSITDFSTDRQTGMQDPFEGIYNGNGYAVGSRVVVALHNGLPRALHVDTERGRLSIATSGATFGHNAGANTFSAAAVYWGAAHKGVTAFTGGASNPVETFSSDGPRKIFYNPDGSPITPGNVLFATSGGKTLQKPDAAGADGVTVRTTGFNPFFGTSAAAPHLAAVAALIKSAKPTLTNTQIRNIMTNTALDDMAPGVDRDTGYGIVTAPAAVSAAKNTNQ